MRGTLSPKRPGYDYEYTFAGRLAENLKNDIEVLNISRMNYSPQIYWRKIKHLMEDKEIDIDYVFLMVDPSDPYEEAYVYKYNLGDEMKRLNFQRPSSADLLNEYFYQSYKVARWLNSLYLIAISSGFNEGIFKTVWIDHANKHKKPSHFIGLKKTIGFYRELNQYLEKRNKKLVLVLYPHGNQIIEKKPNTFFADIVLPIAKEEGIKVLNLYDKFYSGNLEQRNSFLKNTLIKTKYI